MKADEKVTGVSGFTSTMYPINNNSHAELVPFCGTHDVAVQPYSISSETTKDYQFLVTDEGDAFSLPSSSQDSTDSVIINEHPHNNKRSYDSHLDEDYDYYGYDESQSPGLGRSILRPSLEQQKRRFFASRGHKMDLDDDFEEPTFLRSRVEVDSDYAVGTAVRWL